MRPLLALALIAALAGCDALTGDPDRAEVVPSRFLPSEANPLTVPDTVTVGEFFGAVVTTAGGGCEGPGELHVENEPFTSTATLRPFSVVSGAEVCPAILIMHPRATPLVFTELGQAVVRAVGQVGSRGSTRDTTVERAVVVVPRR